MVGLLAGDAIPADALSEVQLPSMRPPLEELVQLLLAEVPTDVFERALQKAARDAEGEDYSEPAQRQIGFAIQLRALLDLYKRRANELAALYDTAGDLSAMRDVDRVLEAIVRRGRQLLGADVAYLMLIDEDRGDTYMRVTEGTVSPGFIGIRLTLGAGLGGLVAQTAAPHWTPNYLQDRLYLHEIDEIVTEEALVAILGVPLKIGRRVTGVLFVADRHQRTFAQEEVSLLSSLGAHAAIAIENASLFQETQEALARLTAAKAVIEGQNEALRRASRMHERLTDLVLEGASAADLALTVVDVLDGTLFVLDAESRLITRAGPAVAEPWASLELVGRAQVAEASTEQIADLLANAMRSQRSVEAQAAGMACRVTPVVAGAQRLGALVRVGDPLSEPDIRSLERAATVMALLLLNQRARDEVEHRVRGELLAELLAGAPYDDDVIRRRAALLGVDLDGPLTMVVLVTHVGQLSGALQAEAAALARALRGLVTTHAGRLVLLMPGTDPGELADRIVRRLSAVAGTKVTAGAAGPLHHLGELAEYERQATRCAKALRVLGRDGQGASARELGVFGLLLSESDRHQLDAFVQETVGPIERYDDSRGTSLVETVEQYFAHDGRSAQAASALFIHTNTLYQRLERVDRIVGSSWRRGDGALEMRLALRLRRLEQG